MSTATINTTPLHTTNRNEAISMNLPPMNAIAHSIGGETSARIAAARGAYTTQHVDRSMLVGITTTEVPQSGDLVLAEVVHVGQHKRLETVHGRRAVLHVGDEILVAYGNRYAPDQFEALVPAHLGECELVAAGGLASEVQCKHDRMSQATRIRPIGLVTNGRKVMNLMDFRLPEPTKTSSQPHTVFVVGTSMNSGKSTTAAALIHGLSRKGVKVGAAKVTGTGAGGDIWMMGDSGASPVYDFTAAGHPSTYQIGVDKTEQAMRFLHGQLADAGVDVAVIEIADGIFQEETAYLLDKLGSTVPCDALMFAAQDATGARAGVTHLKRFANLPLRAVSGVFTSSPLSVREAQVTVDLPIITPTMLRKGAFGDIVPTTAIDRMNGRASA